MDETASEKSCGPRLAWIDLKSSSEAISSGLSVVNVLVAFCVIFSIIAFALCIKQLMSSRAMERLGKILLAPEEELSYDFVDLGLLGRIINEGKTLNSKIASLTSWARNAACIPGSGLVYRNTCYRLTNMEMTYDSVDKYCSLREGYIAYAEDEEIWLALIDYLHFLGFNRAGEVWIGPRKETDDNIWYFCSGHVADFIKWSKGNIFDEGNNCAQIRTDVSSKAAVFDRRCSDGAFALCQYPQVEVSVSFS